jgi:hypothetical protein
MIHVYMLVRRGLLQPALQPAAPALVAQLEKLSARVAALEGARAPSLEPLDVNEPPPSNEAPPSNERLVIAVLQQRVWTGAEKTLLGVLFDLANKRTLRIEGFSHKDFMAKTGLARRSVVGSLASLERAGVVRVDRTTNGPNGNERNTYVLDLAALSARTGKAWMPKSRR